MTDVDFCFYWFVVGLLVVLVKAFCRPQAVQREIDAEGPVVMFIVCVLMAVLWPAVVIDWIRERGK